MAGFFSDVPAKKQIFFAFFQMSRPQNGYLFLFIGCIFLVIKRQILESLTIIISNDSHGMTHTHYTVKFSRNQVQIIRDHA